MFFKRKMTCADFGRELSRIVHDTANDAANRLAAEGVVAPQRRDRTYAAFVAFGRNLVEGIRERHRSTAGFQHFMAIGQGFESLDNDLATHFQLEPSQVYGFMHNHFYNMAGAALNGRVVRDRVRPEFMRLHIAEHAAPVVSNLAIGEELSDARWTKACRVCHDHIVERGYCLLSNVKLTDPGDVISQMFTGR